MCIHPHQLSECGERAALIAALLLSAYRDLSELDVFGEYQDTVDHLAHKAKIAHDASRLAIHESRR